MQAWVVGPGLGTDEAGAAALWFALDTDLPVIVDADALTILAAHPDLVADRTAPTVLTPHAGEFARLAGTPPGDDRVAAARRLADQLGATVLLKGNVTVIAEPRRTRSTSTRPANPGPPPPDPATCCPASSARCWPPGCRPARPPRWRRSCTPAPPTCPPPTPARDPAPTSASRILAHIRAAIADSVTTKGLCHVAQAHPRARPIAPAYTGRLAMAPVPVAADARRVRWTPRPPTASSTTS